MLTCDDEDLAQRVTLALALPEAPAACVKAALALFTGAAAAVHDAGVAELLRDLGRGVARWVHATLAFDSWAASATACGVRAGGPSPIRHLLFNAEGRDIDLRIAPTGESYCLTGQILGPDTRASIELVCDWTDDAAAAPRRAALDDFGEFSFQGLGAGQYRMTLRTGDDGNEAIALPPITIGVRVQ